MYIEFLILFVKYYRTINKRVFLFEWAIPLVVTFVFVYLDFKFDQLAFSVFKDNSINILGILLGFSIAIITILTTGNSKNLDKIKSYETSFSVSLFDLLLINFTYSVILELLIIVCALFVPLFSSIVNWNCCLRMFMYGVFIFGVLHILLLNLRNLTDFYLVVSKPENK